MSAPMSTSDNDDDDDFELHKSNNNKAPTKTRKRQRRKKTSATTKRAKKSSSSSSSSTLPPHLQLILVHYEIIENATLFLDKRSTPLKLDTVCAVVSSLLRQPFTHNDVCRVCTRAQQEIRSSVHMPHADPAACRVPTPNIHARTLAHTDRRRLNYDLTR